MVASSLFDALINLINLEPAHVSRQKKHQSSVKVSKHAMETESVNTAAYWTVSRKAGLPYLLSKQLAILPYLLDGQVYSWQYYLTCWMVKCTAGNITSPAGWSSVQLAILPYLLDGQVYSWAILPHLLDD
jgi:hypothetical protein